MVCLTSLALLTCVWVSVVASQDPLVDKLNPTARATYLAMDKAQQETVRANLKKAHVTEEEDEASVFLNWDGVIGFIDNHLEVEEEGDVETPASNDRKRRSSFDATPDGWTSSGWCCR